MYDLVFIVAPIDCYTVGSQAIKAYNRQRSGTALNEHDTVVLRILRDSSGGMREGAIHRTAKVADNRFKTLKSLVKLLSLGYIVRTTYGRAVYYSITLEGRAVLDDLNARIIAITEAALKRDRSP